MSKAVLVVLLCGAVAAVVGIGLTVLSNWFFRGDAGISGDQVARIVILGLVVGAMPLGLVWARSRKEQK